MQKYKAKQLSLVFAIHLVIALAFYIENLNAPYSSLSSDIQNIIPVAQKFDNPELFKKDLYVNDINNVKYYTPFYVQSLRFLAKFTNGDYVQAVNLMNTVCHLLFGILWFYLIYKFVSNFWIALLISFIARGIVWLPGFEIWGIASLWAMMPRTLYITLFPIPFLVLNKSLKGLFLSAFLIGFIFNCHPITGLGGILLYLTFLVLLRVIFKKKDLLSAKNIAIILLAIVLGMLPFILNYFGKTSSIVNYDMNAFTEAFNTRIPQFFTQPLQYLKQWLHFKTLFYIVPVVLYLIVAKKEEKHFSRAKLIGVLIAVLIILPSVSVYVEELINNIFNLNLRLSFQLIRAQKVAIIPSFFAMAYLLQYVDKKIKKAYLIPALCSVYFVIIVFGKLSIFNNVPFVGDDLTRLVLPNNLSFGKINPKNELAVDKMASFILENTSQDAVIYGGHHYRGASQRSVILDSKGASMIIEGNPARFIQWKKDQNQLAQAKSTPEKINVLYRLGVNYIVARTNYPLEVIHNEGDLKLYKLQ
ncbi:hypothetical protein [Lacinutrix chionoecetis]